MRKPWRVSTRGRYFKGSMGKDEISFDAHVRLEEIDGKMMIAVDVFDYPFGYDNFKEAEQRTSEAFPATAKGARMAEKFLKSELGGVSVKLKVK